MGKIISVLKYYTDKRFSTLAGTLVYFFLMSLAPFFLWLTLLLGSIEVDLTFLNRFFEIPFLQYLKESAESAAGSAGIVLLITTLWSSTNFFYHLRRSGEIVYDSKRVKGGLKLRLVSLLFIAATIFLVAAVGGISVVGSDLLDRFMPFYISDTVVAVFLTALLFSVALVLNLFACPYKMKVGEAVTGSLLTTALWLILLIVFKVYSSFSPQEQLYGKIASLIVFLLWCYAMMSCLVIGMINNGVHKTKKSFSGISLQKK